MKISELQELLDEAKEEHGDVGVVVYNYRSDNTEPVTSVWYIRDQYTGIISLEIY